ncbi:MAG TPA: YlxR family protein [Desulfobulbus sp.]|nr:YlxR family protein [Desulfobulbus sp.]
MRRGHVPIRTCRGCGRKAPKQELIRLVLRQGRVIEDPEQTMDGRGAYCCADETCRQRFMRNRKLQKLAFRLQA